MDAAAKRYNEVKQRLGDRYNIDDMKWANPDQLALLSDKESAEWAFANSAFDSSVKSLGKTESRPAIDRITTEFAHDDLRRRMENQQKAEQEAEQTIRNLKTINDAQQYHSDQQPFEEEDYSFVQKYLEQKKDENDVEWRLFSFSMNSNPWYYWLELGLTIILSLFIVYQLYMKYPKLLKYFTIES
jgi:hypothetical protein